MAKGRRTVKTLFLDSSVLFTAVNSPTGGSAKLFTTKTVKLTTSNLVLTEVERNVRKKLHSYHLERFFMLTEKMEIISQFPSDERIKRAKEVIVEKDAIILAEVKSIKASYLVTLDRKHFLTPAVEQFLKPKRVVTPKMLLEHIK